MVDPEGYRIERQSMNPTDQMVMQALAAQVPNLKTQAQFNIFMACFDAMRTTLNSYFGSEMAAAEMARETLGKALDMAKQIQTISEQVAEMPPEERSKVADDFVSPVKEFHEYDLHKQLLMELESCSDTNELQQWYQENRERLDRVVSQSIRNELFDAIRNKRNELS